MTLCPAACRQSGSLAVLLCIVPQDCLVLSSRVTVCFVRSGGPVVLLSGAVYRSACCAGLVLGRRTLCCVSGLPSLRQCVCCIVVCWVLGWTELLYRSVLD